MFTESRPNHAVILSTVALIFVSLLCLRVRGSYFYKLRKIIDRDFGAILNPCIIILCLVCFTLFLLFTATALKLPDYAASAYCSHRHLKQLVLQGDNQSDWAGLYGHRDLLKLYIRYLDTI